jgi:hypothetical protein
MAGFTRIFLLGILIYKGITARRLYKSFGFKDLMLSTDVLSNATYYCLLARSDIAKVGNFKLFI